MVATRSFSEATNYGPGRMESQAKDVAKVCVKISFKMSKCAKSTNAQNQDGRPDSYWKMKKRMKENAKANPPQPHPVT